MLEIRSANAINLAPSVLWSDTSLGWYACFSLWYGQPRLSDLDSKGYPAHS